MVDYMYDIFFLLMMLAARSKEGDNKGVKKFAHFWLFMRLISFASYAYFGSYISADSHPFYYLAYQVDKFVVLCLVKPLIEDGYNLFEAKYRLDKQT